MAGAGAYSSLAEERGGKSKTVLDQLHAMPSVGGRACSTEGSYITVAE